LLFCLPGTPAVYYGDEVGLIGDKDPDCRSTFPWEENLWNIELRNTIKSLIRMRKNNPAFQQGSTHFFDTSTAPDLVIFSRKYETQEIIIVVNPAPGTSHFSLDVPAQTYRDPLTLTEYSSSTGKMELEISPGSGIILIPKSN
jgi:glycosidase